MLTFCEIIFEIIFVSGEHQSLDVSVRQGVLCLHLTHCGTGRTHLSISCCSIPSSTAHWMGKEVNASGCFVLFSLSASLCTDQIDLLLIFQMYISSIQVRARY